jgi:hypothetical protein
MKEIPKNTRKSRRRGRPSRAEQLAATGVDPEAIDPRRILAQICIDPAAPAAARVAAARTLLIGNGGDDDSAALLSRRAIELMTAKRSR